MPGQKNLRMKAARAAAGLSQSELAEAVGVTRQTIGLIEAGGYNPTLNLCVAICKTLHVTLNDLFWDEERSPVFIVPNPARYPNQDISF